MPIIKLNYFGNLNDFYVECKNFIEEFGGYFEENFQNKFYGGENDDESNGENNDSEDSKINDLEENKIHGGNDFDKIDSELKTENLKNEESKENFISIKMEITTNLLIKCLMFLMIITIIMIVIFVIKIELKPITKLRIPQDYESGVIQPLYHNVKKYDIYNNKGIYSSLKDIRNNIINKDKPIEVPKTIDEKAQLIGKQAEEQMRLEPVVNVGGNAETFMPTKYFSSSYNFGM